MGEQGSHDDLINGIAQQLWPVMAQSEQAMYIYQDDFHKVCNERFASMLGYDSPEEWADVMQPFPTVFVDGGSQQTLVSAYQHAMNNMVGSSIPVTWKTKSGGTVNTTVILVPIAYDGHLFALHFIS